MTAMHCTFTGRVAYRGPLGQFGECHVQVYEAAGTLPVVVATELDDNEGTSITNAAGEVATHVWRTLLPHAREGFRWIEHYPARAGHTQRTEAFDEVTFTLVGPFELATPDWRPRSRAAVEALIGAPLPPAVGEEG